MQYITHNLKHHVASTPSDTARQSSPTDDPGLILVVEDHLDVAQSITQQLEYFGHIVAHAPDGYSALAWIFQHQPDLILLDVNLPDMNGYDICSQIKHDPQTWRIPIVIMTVETEYEAQLRGIESEADQYMHKPINARELEARVRMLLRAKRRTDRMEQAEDVIFSLARAVEAKDAYTEGHLQRLAYYAQIIGQGLGVTGRDLEALRHGAVLHDVGKVGIDEAIIRKGGPLTPTERSIMEQHPLIGERIVQPLRMARAVAPIVRHHHERWDGQGYPDKLAGETIPLGARIVAVADAFDAMTTQRPYNRVLTFSEASMQLVQGAGVYWDPSVVELFVDWLQHGAQERAVGE